MGRDWRRACTRHEALVGVLTVPRIRRRFDFLIFVKVEVQRLVRTVGERKRVGAWFYRRRFLLDVSWIRTNLPIDGKHTRLSGFFSASMATLFRFAKPENMSEKSPPRLKPKFLSSILGGVAVLA